MKILYAVQATGNGHISRAMELLPYLQQYGKVDIFLSGANSSLAFDQPIKFRSKGLSLFYNCRGSLDYFKTATRISLYRLWKEILELPVEKYDLVLNDFELVTAMACAYRKVPSVGFGHQASFISEKTPRPEKRNFTGEMILKHYAIASYYVGLHFKQYDDFILPPVIKKEIKNAEPLNRNFIVVYLPSYCEPVLKKHFNAIPGYRFYIFSRDTKEIHTEGNSRFLPVNKELFNTALIECSGIITGAGFETPAEALTLGKRLMVMPIKGQYEQYCNAAALEQIGVKKIDKLDDDFPVHFSQWIESKEILSPVQEVSTEKIVEKAMTLATAHLRDRHEKNSYKKPGSFIQFQ